MDFGPFGLSEVVFIGLLALVLFGPRRLPELMRSVGAVVTTLRRGTEDLKRSFQQELDGVDGGAGDELRDAAKSLRSAGEDVRAIGRKAAEQGRRLMTGEGAVSRPARPEPAAPAREEGGGGVPAATERSESPAVPTSEEAEAAPEPLSGDER